MRFLLPLLVVSLSGCTSGSGARPPASPGRPAAAPAASLPRVVVTRTVGRAFFPVRGDERRERFAASTPDGANEVYWLLAIPGPPRSRSLGFLIDKPAGARPVTAAIGELLPYARVEAGEALGGPFRRALPTAGIAVTAVDGGVLLTVRGADRVDEFFGHRPAVVALLRHTRGAPSQVDSVRVSYQ